MKSRETKIVHMVPAGPGFHVITPVWDLDQQPSAVADVGLDPVVAWAMDDLGIVYPVTAGSGLEDQGSPAVLCPDGVVRAYEQDWPSQEAWLLEQAIKPLV